ncbi:YwqG family protein [Streptomyces sp. NPDC050428]|uniref:YwqG family protein n=1 Tax=Streptomyces sp. NPDC050428 TaxID=3155757 RepID=UPI0034304CCE
MDREALLTLLRDSLPATYRQVRLELTGPGPDLAADGGVTVRLCLHNDGTGEYGEQTVQLVPSGQDPERADSYVQAWARSLPSLLACVVDRSGGRSLTPGVLEFPQLVLGQSRKQTASQLTEQFTDPRAVRALAAAADAANAAEWIRDVCRDVRMDKHADALVGLRRTGIDLIPAPAGSVTGRTRLGGLPDAASDAAWPCRGDRPMTFLAQIDLAEISPFDDDRLLPSDGLLHIFADLSSGIAWDDTAHGPGVLIMTGRPPDTRALGIASAPAGAQVFPRRPVVPAVDLSLPPLESPFYRDLTDLDLTGCDPADPGEEFAAFIEFLNEFHPPLADEDRPRHRLLGYADPLQGDPWEECATAEPGVPPARWQLLAQIDSEPDALLGDSGVIYIFVPCDALSTGDFTKARGVRQMY